MKIYVWNLSTLACFSTQLIPENFFVHYKDWHIDYMIFGKDNALVWKKIMDLQLHNETCTLFKPLKWYLLWAKQQECETDNFVPSDIFLNYIAIRHKSITHWLFICPFP